jgi:hypothetical protein
MVFTGRNSRISSYRIGRLGLAMVLTVLVATSGCTVFKVGKRPPDEFAVVTSAPLIIPPDYGLRPVEPSVLREREIARENEIEEVLFGDVSLSEELEASPGEMALLRRIGALSVDDEIRDQIRRENAKLANVEEKTGLSRLKWWDDEDNTSEWSEMLGRGQQHDRPQRQGGVGSARPDR